MPQLGRLLLSFRKKCLARTFVKSIHHETKRPTKFSKFRVGVALTAVVGTSLYYLRPEQERRFVRVTFGGIVRFFRSSYIGSVISADYYWTLWKIPEDDPKYTEALSELHYRAANRILQGCLRNGGLYIKLGQGLVIMDHILPKEYINVLKVLQDKCLGQDPKEVHQLFLEDFGNDISHYFSSFDEKPIAAASLAQVFKATTKDGNNVAVKTQYIDLQDRFIGDIVTLHILLKIAAFIYPDFDFGWVLNELKGTLEKELNFLNEGKNSEQCAKDLSALKFIHVPKVYWNLCSKRVLTTEFIDGIKISDANELKKNGFALADIDDKLFKAFSEQIFYTGFVHADPHPGNILVRKAKNKSTELVILDHGLYEEVPKGVRDSLRNLWKSMVLNDHALMKKYSVELGIKEGDYRLFCIALGQRYIPAADKTEKDADVIRRFFSPQNVLKSGHLTAEEKAKLNLEFSALRIRSFEIFKDMPKKLMLVTRNINTIRSIARGHGDPINRYKVMARYATYRSFSPSNQNTVTNLFKQLYCKADFEIKLWWGGVRAWFLVTFLKIVTVILGEPGRNLDTN